MENLSNEIWKDIIGYEGLYQVSSLGRINSLKTKRILKPVKTSFGHTKIKLSKDKKVRTFLIHRIVAECFLEHINGKEIVNHINSIQYDNRVENLEWCTVQENVHHAIKHGNMNPVVSQTARANAKKSRSKKVINILTGDIYNSITDAARENNLVSATLVDYLLGRYKNKTYFRLL